MINIAFINPAHGHSTRGIGFYVKNLLNEFMQTKFAKLINVYTYSSESEIPKDLDINIVHYPFFDLFNHSLPLISKYKRVVTIHDVIPLKYPLIYKPGKKGQIKFTLQKLSLLNINGVITDSYSSLIDIKKYLYVSDSKISLIPLAPGNHFSKIKDIRLLNEVKKKFDLPKEFIIYVGDINYNKNLSILIKSCITNKVNLVMVGKSAASIYDLDTNHPELAHVKELKDLITGNSLVKTVGFVTDQELVCLYNLATLTCMPSISEGFGLSVIESLSCGTPVICSDTSSLGEFNSDSIFKFDPTNQNELNKLVHDLFKNTKKLNNLSDQAVKYAKNFSWSKVAFDTLNTYMKYI